MISRQLRQKRLAHGLSLDALAQQMDGIVTKQALSKYEQGKAMPSARILTKLAAALGVKTADLLAAPDFTIEFIAYRKRATLGVRDQEQIESRVAEAIQHRVRVQEAIGQGGMHDIPLQSLRVETLDDAERAAEQLRQRWDVGNAPIANLTAILEDHAVHVVTLDAADDFDGIAAIARDAGQRVLAATVATRAGGAGERQRLSLAHEVGHVVLDPADTLDPEKAAFRFGAAFLAPAQMVQQRVGRHRHSIELEELILLKQFFGLSIQALLHRLFDLGIITAGYYHYWCSHINQLGLRLKEPAEMLPEQSTWLRTAVLRAVSEDLMSSDDASLLLGEPYIAAPQAALVSRRAFLRLPPEERQHLLAQQAEALRGEYAPDPERDMWQGGDIVDDER